MFDNLKESLSKAIKSLKGQGKISEINIASTVKEIRRALVRADVNFKIAKEVTNNIKEKALGRDVLIAVSPGQLLTKIVSEELAQLMGGEKTDLKLEGSPAVIMVVGLQGAGKTTLCGKLANYVKEKQKKETLLIACDVYRPAAIQQLQVLGEQIGVEVYTESDSKDVLSIAQNGLSYAKTHKKKVVIIDTAGRLAIDEDMMNEVIQLKSSLKPSETLFVVDSMTGQDAVNTAKAFNDRLDYDGIVLTKLDGDARGGAALSIRAIVHKPIKFISTGEKMTNLDIFHPDRMADRILGMGDVISVVERAQQVFDEKEALRITKKIEKNKFDYEDFLSQITQIEKLGSIKEIMGMLPGMGDKIKGEEIDENMFQPFKVIISSMTPYERKNPDALDKNRCTRIAKGSGRPIEEVNKMTKHFNTIRTMMKKLHKGGNKSISKLTSLFS